MPKIISYGNGPSTSDQLILSFKNAISRNYKVLILGNSRTYRGLNPDVFKIKTFNFSHDDDSYNQMFYKLKFLLSNNKRPDYLILGIDYFQFSFKSDRRNYVYFDLFDESYRDDFTSGYLKYKLEYYLGNIDIQKLSYALNNSEKPRLKSNGQYIRPGTAHESDSIKRDINRLEFQVLYFKKIIELCKEEKIKVFLVMLPIRSNELLSYKPSELEQFNSFLTDLITGTDISYLNYSESRDFKMTDFTDITHLNEAAADRFSKLLDKDLQAILSSEIY